MAVNYGLLVRKRVHPMTMTRNSKKKAGRPKGSAVRFPGIKAFAAEQGVTPLHVYMVLTGRRHSRRVTEAWQRQRGA